jgi:hypothetical protein
MKQPDKQPKQEVDEQLVGRLMALIRGQFCGDMTPKDWAQMSNFIRRNVVLWPARFITGKSFTITGARYEQIMREIFDDIKRKGNTGAVRRWPGYLMMCVQSHFKINWETYYRESKSVSNIALHTMATLGKVGSQDKTVEALAMAQKVLASKHEKRKLVVTKKPSDNRQLSMFEL